MAILQLGVIIFDLVMGSLFVRFNAGDIPELYIPRFDDVIFVYC
jgi:hypothetical protein